MCHLKLTGFLIVLSATLSCHQAAPISRQKNLETWNGTSKSGWRLAVQSKHIVLTPVSDITLPEAVRDKRHQVEKRKCNTATCVTQRLADFLVRTNNNHGPIYSPTNVGSYTYGKRDIVGLLRRESFDYLQH
ncbi:islet amyloid polypeptide [Pseudophryne corroboree]|uniref:islet amyloid polypeptide n=1 Tax=Pseudophryne corroboree TaxID=495146 RepID=UPI00308171AD